MLSAYYSCGCDSEKLFCNLKIAEDKDFRKYLNKYNVIFLNMQEFLSAANNIKEMLEKISRAITWELLKEYASVSYYDTKDMNRMMWDIYDEKQCPFVIIIDEWDMILRNIKHSIYGQTGNYY